MITLMLWIVLNSTAYYPIMKDLESLSWSNVTHQAVAIFNPQMLTPATLDAWLAFVHEKPADPLVEIDTEWHTPVISW